MQVLLVASALVLTAAAHAQIGRDQWIVTAFTDYITTQSPGGLWLVDAARTTATPLSGQTTNMLAANCAAVDDAGFVYYGTLRSTSVPVPNPSSIVSVIVAGTTVITETVLNTSPIDSGSISGLCVVRDRIWYASDSGNIGWIPKAGGAATVLLNVTAAGVRGLAQSIASDGREVFVGTSHTASTPDPANVWAIDSLSATPTLRPLAFLNGSAFALSMARDGMVLAGRVGGQLWLVDPRASTATQINPGATAPQSNCNGTAMNPWLNVTGNVAGYGGAVTRLCSFHDAATNSWPQQLPLNTAIPSGVASSHEEPFVLFGQGCHGVNGQEPRLGWNGMPMQGQSFALTLRAADQGVAFLFLGISNANGPLGSLPSDLAVVGAPGCSEYVSLEATAVALVDASGNASTSISVPNNSGLAGVQLFAQWGVATNVNALGLAVSDAVHVRLR